MPDEPHERRPPLDVRGMLGDEPLFLLGGAVRRSAAVADWLDGEPTDLRGLARVWFEHVRACGDDVHELLHDGCPVACVQGAAFAYVNAFKAHVNVGFYHGASLLDPARLLEGRGKRMRHVKLRPDVPVDEAALRALIRAAHRDVVARLHAGA